MSIHITFAKRHVAVSYSSQLERAAEHENYIAAQEERRNLYSGEIGESGRRKIRKIVECWAQAIRYEDFLESGKEKDVSKSLGFITLTLPAKQMHSDKYLNRHALGRFLVILARKHDANRYLWRAETQENGNLHWHILVDKFIDWRRIKEYWNRIMSDLGYIEAYAKGRAEYFKNGFRYSKKELTIIQKTNELKAYNYGIDSKWQNPNSTDIHNLCDVENVEAYVSKYCSKEGEGRGVWAQKWGCSDSLRDLEHYKIEASTEEACVILDEVRKKAVEVVENDFCIIYVFKKHHIVKEIDDYLFHCYVEHHANQRQKMLKYTAIAEQVVMF